MSLFQVLYSKYAPPLNAPCMYTPQSGVAPLRYPLIVLHSNSSFDPVRKLLLLSKVMA